MDFCGVFRSMSGEEKVKFYTSELKFLERAIAAQHKSYWVWYQRKWIVTALNSLEKANWEHEVSLCNAMLLRDERNCMHFIYLFIFFFCDCFLCRCIHFFFFFLVGFVGFVVFCIFLSFFFLCFFWRSVGFCICGLVT